MPGKIDDRTSMDYISATNKDDLLATVKVFYEWSYILSYPKNKWFGRDIHNSSEHG